MMLKFKPLIYVAIDHKKIPNTASQKFIWDWKEFSGYFCSEFVILFIMDSLPAAGRERSLSAAGIYRQKCQYY